MICNIIKYGSGVARLNREAGKVRRGPATVTASDAAFVNAAFGGFPVTEEYSSLGRRSNHDELEPGELPD